MRTLGVDLATQDRDTAACLVVWSGRPRVEFVAERNVSDSLILELAESADVTAIDAPFGWPIAFSRHIASYASGAPWPTERPDGLWLRRTDYVATQQAGGRMPLSVSSDRIARPAERAARLLTRLGRDGRAAARDGSDGVIEVYPAGALRHWGIDVGDYKARGARETRERIVRNILESLRFASDPQLVVSLALTDHGTDALVAALVGRAFARGTSFRPAEDEAALAQIEGWIHMPMGALGELGSDPAATPRE